MNRERLAVARRLAEGQGGVVSRRQLYDAGLAEIHVRRAVESGRWQTHGRQTVAVHTAPLEVVARRWRAVWEVGASIAAIDGVTALQVAGLTGYDDDRIHVSVKHNHNTVNLPGVVIHKVIRRVPGELVSPGLPRVRPALAAVRAAHWSVSNRQAALVLLMSVQQRLTTPRLLAAAQGCARPDPPRVHPGGRRRHRLRRAVARRAGLRGALPPTRTARARAPGRPTRAPGSHLPGRAVGLLRPRRRDRRRPAPRGGQRHA